jgi:hypothetical protein
MCTCYDFIRNIIWTYNEQKIEGWKNLGLAPKHAYSSKPSLQKYPNFTPEAVLSQISYSPTTESVLPLQAVLVILANMDRLARQHPIYWEKVIPEV